MFSKVLESRVPTRCDWMTGYQSFVISTLYVNLCNLSAWKQFVLVSWLNCPFYNPVYIGNLFNRPHFIDGKLYPCPSSNSLILAKCHLNSWGYIALRIKKKKGGVPNSINQVLAVSDRKLAHTRGPPDQMVDICDFLISRARSTVYPPQIGLKDSGPHKWRAAQGC